jgi:hypothetical protein
MYTAVAWGACYMLQASFHPHRSTIPSGLMADVTNNINCSCFRAVLCEGATLRTNMLKQAKHARITVKHVRFEVSTAVTMKNAIFWDIKTQFIPHRRHITSPLQSPAG